MKVDTMRKVDYYTGVPLCFVVTMVQRIIGLFRPARAVKPKNVLLLELSEMGSAILVDPAMRKLKDAGAQLHFAIFEKNAPSLRLLQTVPEENIFKIRENSFITLALDTLRLLVWARRRHIDTVIDLELFSRYTALLTGLSGAANRVGYYGFHNEGLYRGEMLTHRVAYNPHIHIAKGFVALVNAALSEKKELPYSKTLVSDDEIVLAKAPCSDEEKTAMHALIKENFPDYTPERHRIVLINPNASELLIQRRWMPEYYVELMRTVLDTYDDVVILITGAPGERTEAQGLKERVDNDRCVNFAGCVRFEALVALYNVATLMVTNDSGPGHFSAVTELRTFVIFGPETPNLYGSLGNSTPIFAGLACSPCVSASNHRKTPCVDNVCLQVIKPQRVFDTIRPVLDEPRT